MLNPDTERIESATPSLRTKHIGIILGSCLIVYGQTAFFGFVTFDDPVYSYANAIISSGISLEGLCWAVSLDTIETHSNWIPLTFLSLMADAELYGDWAGGFHLTNVGLHMGNSVLLYLLFCRLTGRQTESAIVALIFAVHPLHVESVAWVTERKDVLSTFFGFLAVLCYVNWVRTRRRRAYFAAVLGFLLSLLAKQTLVTLPFLLLLLDFWPLRRLTTGPADSNDVSTETESHECGGRTGATGDRVSAFDLDLAVAGRRLFEKLPFLALSIVFSLTVYFAQADGGGELDGAGQAMGGVRVQITGGARVYRRAGNVIRGRVGDLMVHVEFGRYDVDQGGGLVHGLKTVMRRVCVGSGAVICSTIPHWANMEARAW